MCSILDNRLYNSKFKIEHIIPFIKLNGATAKIIIVSRLNTNGFTSFAALKIASSGKFAKATYAGIIT